MRVGEEEALSRVRHAARSDRDVVLDFILERGLGYLEGCVVEALCDWSAARTPEALSRMLTAVNQLATRSRGGG